MVSRVKGREPYQDWSSEDGPIHTDLSRFLPTLRTIRAYGNTRDFERISSFAGLEELRVHSLSQKNAELVSSLKNLRRLFLRWGGFTDFGFLRDLKGLDSLIIWQTSRLRALDGIEGLDNLRELTLFEATSLKRSLPLQPLGNLSRLWYLELRGPMVVDTLSHLRSLGALSRLDLFAEVEDRSLSPLREIPSLTELDMWVLEKRYSLEELAIAAAIAPNLLDKWLDFQSWGSNCKKCGAPKLGLIGRGTRAFCPVCQPKRGEEFAAAFREMVSRSAWL